MSFAVTSKVSVTRPSAAAKEYSVTITNGEAHDVSQAISRPQTNLHILWNHVLSAGKYLCFACDVDVTISVNAASGSSPDQTLALKANDPLVYRYGGSRAHFLNQDVTAGLYLTIGGTGTANFEIFCVEDPTV